MTVKTSGPLCVDLFCGAGGLSEGLKMAGFTSIFAVDFDKHAGATYAKNHPCTELFVGDIANVQTSQILAAAKGREVDLLCGGPSCQGYSTHGKRQADDPRNFLFEHFVRLAEGIRPKWILIENVQGLLTYQNGYFKKVIIERLRGLGYEAEAKVLTAADYGVPQLRKRIFFVATRTGVPITFPEPTHGDNVSTKGKLQPYVTVGEALADLPALQGERLDPFNYVSGPVNEFLNYVRDGAAQLTLHENRALSTQAMSIARHVREGEGLRSVPVEFLPERFQKMRRISNGALRQDCTTLYHRLSRTRPSYTITCNFRNIASGPFLHPVENRSLSTREAARLMSFRDTYEFVGSSLPRQIGNAVPPLLAKAVGEHIVSLIRKEKRYSKLAA
jgi:DNA (cytosine-5)-methyltransferase 1